MASPKRIGFFWDEDKITIVEFEKNLPLQVVSSRLGPSKASAASPFSSSLTEEIQITATLQKMMHDNHITGGTFYVSLPAREIILRSFIIPFVKPDVIQNAVKFEAKKYMPFDIQDVVFVYHTFPFAEGATKRLQVIFFAARKEVFNRYERIFKQVNTQVTYCEPYMVSLTKALLFRKEIKATDHLAFLILGKNLGRICFIDQGIPQFIREFPLNLGSELLEGAEPSEEMNSKIVNEVGNSFDFYARQFSGDRIEQMLVSSDFIQRELMNSLETELKVKLTKFSPVIPLGMRGQSNDIDAIYAMGACVNPPTETLAALNFLKSPKSKYSVSSGLGILSSYKEILYVFLMCLTVLTGIFFFNQMRLKTLQQQYAKLSAQEGAFLNETVDSIQAQTQQSADKLSQYKGIRTRSDITFVILKVASHLPQGVLINNLSLAYDSGDSVTAHVSIDMKGDVFKEDPDEQIAVVNKVFSDLKHDQELSKFITNVNLVSLNREQFQGRQVTGFTIHCS